MNLDAAAQRTTFEAALGVQQILPSQYYDLSAGHRLSGEQKLMLALLADAINVYQQGALSRKTRQRLLYLEAERWIADQQGHQPFSFETVCDALGINPAVLRRRLVNWKYETLRSQAAPKTAHLRIKITPRPQRMSHRRRRSAMAARA